MARLVRYVVLGVALFLSVAVRPGWTQAQSSQQSTNDSGVHLAAPYPSPQQLPGSSAFPGGVNTSAAASSPGESGDTDAPTEGKHRGEFIIAPIPISNQAVHFGLVPVVQYVLRIDRSDTVSPPSSLVLASVIATRGTWALGGGGQMYLKQDRYRVTAFAGHGSVGYDIFGVGSQSGDAGKAIPIRQHGTMGLGEVLFRIVDHLYLGPRFNYRTVSAAFDVSSESAELPGGLDPNDFGVVNTEYGYGLKLLQDTRKDVFYPTTGHTLEIEGDYYETHRSETSLLPEKSLSYQNYVPSYNHYLSLTKTQILALRGMICTVNGNPPFYDLCQFGWQSDIRGYQIGRYRDRRMFAAQAEYRKTLGARWGFTVFDGIGEVAHSWNEFTAGDLLPAGGVGARFNLSKKQRINLRADVAYGKNGWSWNFSLGEAF
jgi:hypothetical protein